MKSSNSGYHPPSRSAKLLCLHTPEQGCPETRCETFICHRAMASAAEKKLKLLLSRAAQHVIVLLNEGGRLTGMVGKLGLMRSSPILPAIPKQLAVQLLWSLARPTLLDAEEHIQVWRQIQGGRRQLDQDTLSLPLNVGPLKEKSGKGRCRGQGNSLTKFAAARSKPGWELNVTTLPITTGPLSSKISLMNWLKPPRQDN